MSNEKEQELQPVQAVKPTGEVVETSLMASPIIVPAGQLATIKARAKRLDKMEAGIPLNGTYFEFKEGVPVRGQFIGFKSITKADEDTGEIKHIECAYWIDKDERMMMNGGAGLIKQFAENGVGLGTPFQATLLGEEKRKSGPGKVKIYEVRILSDVADE